MVHDTGRGGQDNETELTRGQQVVDPVFNRAELDVEAGGNDTALVQTTNELNNNLARSMVINDFEFTNVTLMI